MIKNTWILSWIVPCLITAGYFVAVAFTAKRAAEQLSFSRLILLIKQI
ncbi:hypothetical protein SAMN04488137_4524 [Fictibacillus solisalsi]|uniref:Uncharacterized protein n=1 Tax=Fictibacillus solisalsi TaxID=459525 RepID=A0A1H0BJY1_9BACL|nr:hypothetical protein [Fictibacillus solisalsi]SDN45927.1 hypothetical protein SAMN04488137_4524 [Fictibacillus solisalsi]